MLPIGVFFCFKVPRLCKRPYGQKNTKPAKNTRMWGVSQDFLETRDIMNFGTTCIHFQQVLDSYLKDIRILHT